MGKEVEEEAWVDEEAMVVKEGGEDVVGIHGHISRCCTFVHIHYSSRLDHNC